MSLTGADRSGVADMTGAGGDFGALAQKAGPAKTSAEFSPKPALVQFICRTQRLSPSADTHSGICRYGSNEKEC